MKTPYETPTLEVTVLGYSDIVTDSTLGADAGGNIDEGAWT